MDDNEVRRIIVESAVNFEEIKYVGLDVSFELEYVGWTNFFSIIETLIPKG